MSKTFTLIIEESIVSDLVNLLNEAQKHLGLNATEATYRVLQVLKNAKPEEPDDAG